MSKKEFTTDAPINKLKLTSQNGRLYSWLMSGKTIHCMDKARASDLINKFKIPLKKKHIMVKNDYGEDTMVVLYRIEEKFRKQAKAA